MPSTAKLKARGEANVMGKRILVFSIIAALLIAAGPANAAIRIRTIAFDPSGSDTGSNSSLNREFVVLKNTGNRRVSLRRWRLVDGGADHTFRFPRFTLRAGRRVTIHTGRGRNDGNDLFWDLDNYVWNNDGDRATLKRRSGRVVDRSSYSSSASSPVAC
jgi:hypothetical protein